MSPAESQGLITLNYESDTTYPREFTIMSSTNQVNYTKFLQADNNASRSYCHALSSDCLLCRLPYHEGKCNISDELLKLRFENSFKSINQHLSKTYYDGVFPQSENLPAQFEEAEPMILNYDNEDGMLETIGSRVINWMRGYIGFGTRCVRGIGISAKRRLIQFINTILIAVRPALGRYFNRISSILRQTLVSSIDFTWDFVSRNFEGARKTLCSLTSMLLAGLAICLPSQFVSTIGRILFGAMALVVAFSQSYFAVGISGTMVYLLTRMTSKYNIVVNTNINNNIPRVEPQDLRSDTRSLLTDMVTLSILISASTTGISFPTDSKSWDDLLNRHSKLHRASQAWNFGIDKLTDIFDRTAHYIFKHLLGREYTSVNYISEIESLYTDVMHLCRLDVNIQIGRDPQLAVKIEQMYLRYMALCKIYASNRLVMAKLTKLGAPLTDYYRRVTDKNPKSHVMRKEPVCIALCGATGIGKSYMMSRFQQDILKICGKFNPNMPMEGLVYARAIEQEFWDGYIGQPIAIYDDFGQKVDSQANPNLEFFEMIRAVNIFPYPLHTAALQDKANTPFTSDFVILTTNLSNFKVQSIHSQEAFKRRIHLNMRVKIIAEVGDVVDGHLRLNVTKLEEYRINRNLQTSDMSHLIFVDENGKQMNYDDFVILVSKQYRVHKEAFDQRQTDNDLTANDKLPAGAFSVDDTWMAEPQMASEVETDFLEDENDLIDFDTDAMVDEEFSYEDYVRVTRPVHTVQQQIDSFNFQQRYNPVRLVNLSIQEFNRVIRTRFIQPIGDTRLARTAIELWHGLTEIRNVVRQRAQPVWNFFAWVGKIFFVVSFGAMLWHRIWVDKQQRNLANPYLTSLAQTFLASVDVIVFSVIGNDITFALTLGAVTIQLSRTILRDLFYHSLYHKTFEIECEVCKKNEKILKLCEESAYESTTEDVMKHHARIEEIFAQHEATYESSMKTQTVKNKVQVESPNKMQERKQRVVVESEGILHLFPEFESGRASDDKKKNRISAEMESPEAEGIACVQTEALKGVIRRNTWIVEAHFDNRKEHIGMVTTLKGLKTLINNHYLELISVYYKECLDKSTFKLYFKQPNMDLGHVGNLREIVTKAVPVYRGQHQTEFYMITLPPSCNFGRDLTKHLIEAKKASCLVRGVPVQLVTYRSNGERWEPTTVSGPLEKIHKVQMPNVSDKSKHHIYLESAYYNLPSMKGDCGSCVLIDSNEFSKKILGFHFAGLPGTGIASVITAGDVEHLVKDEMCLADPQHIILDEIPDFPLRDSSFQAQGLATVNISHPCRTSLEPSLVHGLFCEPQMKPAYLAPPLTPDGPMIRGLQKSAGEVNAAIDECVLEEAKREYFEVAISAYKPLPIEQKVLDFETACKGIEGNNFFPPIKRSKSAGYPLMAYASKGKTDWFGSDEWDFSSQKCKELKESVKTLVVEAANGIIPEAVFVATLKDEKRLIEKVDAKKTRVFSACPLPYLVAFRRYFSGFIAFMGRNKISNESAIGTNCHGYDWKEIVRHLTPWSEQSICAGDFKEFDGTFHPVIFDSLITIINGFYQGTKGENQIRKSLWRALVNPLHLMGPYIFSFSHGQPSGSPITAISNSMYVSVCTRYVLYPSLKTMRLKFNDHFRMIAYGDDSLISVSPQAKEIIDPYLISLLFKTIGMNYTTADKTEFEEFQDYDRIEDVTFLKRGFSHDQSRSHWFAPLDLVSIREMCNWIRKSSSSEQATIENCSSALQELCHHPKRIFEEYSETMVKACRELGIIIHVPNWDVVRTQMSLGQIDYMSDERPFV